MIFYGTKLKVLDNSGVKVVKSFGGGSHKRPHKANVFGDRITGSILASSSPTLKKGMVIRSVVVQTVKGMSRASGSALRFEHNGTVLWNMDTDSPLGTRVYGAMPYELRKTTPGGAKILAMADMVL